MTTTHMLATWVMGIATGLCFGIMLWRGRPRERILALFAICPATGAEITKITGIGPGTLHPILFDLETEGVIASDFEQPEAGEIPRQVVYWLKEEVP